MAYNADNEVKEELAVVRKNNRGDHIVVQKVTSKTSGSVSVDVRNYYTNDDEQLLPTSKGIRINSEVLPEVLQGVLQVLDVTEIEDIKNYIDGLLDDEDNTEDEVEE